MKIGEFAKRCNTKISVLRHYDSIGLLRPVYIDRFTEYRYYDESQTAVFEQITTLKNAGFSLDEIRRLMYSLSSPTALFEAKRKEFELKLSELSQLEKTFKGGIKMENKFTPLVEDIDSTFENDEQVIGKWEILYEQSEIGQNALPNKYIYFLPGGEQYWCFGWTKGSLIINDGESRYKNSYRLEQRGDDLYMILSLKSPEYVATGETTAIALRKLDSTRYTKAMLSKKDDIIKPFIDDKRILGKWKAFCFLDSGFSRASFIPNENPPKGSSAYLCDPYFKSIEFKEGGVCVAEFADETIEGNGKHSWTRGYWLRKYNSTACAYEIKEFDGVEYLIIEWKSGDYRFGNQPTDYYVMKKV